MLWNNILSLLHHNAPLIDLATAVLWGVYIFFTIKTFREMHRQTELQTDAFLLIAYRIERERPVDCRDKIDARPAQVCKKWSDILRANIPDAIGHDGYLVISLENSGRSDIVEWTLKFAATVRPGSFLDSLNTRGDTFEWILKSNGSEDYVRIGKKTELIIAQIGSFPSAQIRWEVVYTDARGKSYSSCAGAREAETANSLAYDFRKK